MFQNGARAFFCFFSTFHLRNSRLFKLRAHEGRFEGFQMRSFTFYLEGEKKKKKTFLSEKLERLLPVTSSGEKLLLQS